MVSNSLLEEFIKRKVLFKYEDMIGNLTEYDSGGCLKISLKEDSTLNLPRLYERGQWIVEDRNKNYYFTGEIKERYSQNNVCMILVRILDGIYFMEPEKQISYSKGKDAVIITSRNEKFPCLVKLLNPNIAVLETDEKIPENVRIWLKINELAVAGNATLMDNNDLKYIYNLDFINETVDKKSKVAEMILKNRL